MEHTGVWSCSSTVWPPLAAFAPHFKSSYSQKPRVYDWGSLFIRACIILYSEDSSESWVMGNGQYSTGSGCCSQLLPMWKKQQHRWTFSLSYLPRSELSSVLGFVSRGHVCLPQNPFTCAAHTEQFWLRVHRKAPFSFAASHTHSLYIFTANINIQGDEQNILRLEGLNTRLSSPQAACGALKADSLLVTAQPPNPSDMCNREGN